MQVHPLGELGTVALEDEDGGIVLEAPEATFALDEDELRDLARLLQERYGVQEGA